MSMFRRLRGTGPGSSGVNGHERAGNRKGISQADAEGSSAFPFRPHPESDQHETPFQPAELAQTNVSHSVASEASTNVPFYHLTPPRHAPSESELGDPLGLRLIHGASDSSVDIIFVHGLGGSSTKTWSWERNVDLFWPEWIRHEEGLSERRVFSYGYNSNFWDSGGPFSIMDFSKGLLVGMKNYGRGGADGIGQKPIIFIAHSMGGLVVKKALIIGKNDHHYSRMLSMVHGIMFFSTPHRGSSHARTLNSLLVMLGSRTKVYVSELDTSSTSIEDINEQFRTICSHLQLVSLYETFATRVFAGVKKMIVSEESGVLNYPNELSSPVDADHHTICKFRSRLDPNYVHAMNLLRHLASRFSSHVPSGLAGSATEHEVRILQAILGIEGNFQRDLDRNLGNALPGSCEWLFLSETFKEWMDASDSHHRVFWLTGGWGSGKSTLAAKAITHIQKAIPCQYHFFTGAQPMRSVAFCLRTLAFQLATAYPTFAERLIRFYEETKFSATLQNFQVIWETIFENIIFKMDFGRTLYWVLDAPDEADTPELFVECLAQIQSRSSIKILVLSRPSVKLMDLLAERQGSAVVEPIPRRHTSADIRNYTMIEVARFLPDDKALQQSVVEHIAYKAEGSFLWTKLVLESLRGRYHTLQDIDNVLDNTPTELRVVYNRMLDDVKAQPRRLQDIAFRILTWVACSYRPLTTTELAAALKPEFDGFVSLEETVLQVCGQFIHIQQDTVSFIHETARQFLLQGSLDIPIVHDHPAVVCLQHLSNNTLRQALARASGSEMLPSSTDKHGALYGEHPLLDYAMGFWAYHVGLSSADAPKVVSHLRRFCNEFMLLWVHAMALSGNLRGILGAAVHLRKWLRQGRRFVPNGKSPTSISRSRSTQDTAFVEQWVIDLTKLVSRFGAKLEQSPSAIHRHVPPFCPKASIIRRIYYRDEDPLITVHGLSNEKWDDNLARLSVGQEHETAVKVRCAGSFVFILNSSGTVIVWHAETLKELRRICHGGWVRVMETNKSGSMVATDGKSAICVWNTSNVELIYSLPKHNGERVKSMDFFITGLGLVVAYDDCSVISHDLQSSTETALFAPQGQDELWNCPRFIISSPDHTRTAVGFPGRPLQLWDMGTLPQRKPRSAVCPGDRARLEAGQDIFNPVDLVRWHPDGSVLYILHQDTTILAWDLVDDAQSEFSDTEAREMAVNPRGTSLLTSNSRGSISVWGLPKFNLIYRLQLDQFVRDLTFSPDGQRIYDVRGSNFNVWAPHVLARLEEVDLEGESDNCDRLDCSAGVPEPVFAQDKSQQSRITVLVSDDEDEFYCCGKDDGSVSIHEMRNGVRVRKVSNHSTAVDITAIVWSSSRRFIASADDSGRILVKRLKIKDDDKWAVYPLFELRVTEDGVTQLLFSLDETLLLVSTHRSDRVWDVKGKVELCKVTRESRPGLQWINHPSIDSQLICVEPEQLQIYTWASLTPVAADMPRPLDPQVGTSTPTTEPPLASSSQLGHSVRDVRRVIMPKSRKYLLYETFCDRNPNLQRQGKELCLVQVSDVTPETCASIRRKELMGLGPEIRHILGTSHDRLFFLDHDNWVCTSTIGWDMGSKRRLYFLPGDWVNDSMFSLMLVNEARTLLCAQYGEVAIVRYNGRI